MSQDRLDASLDIDKASSLEIIRIIQDEDARVAAAVSAERDRIAHAVDQIVERLSHGGRLFYAGAGTSGILRGGGRCRRRRRCGDRSGQP